MSGTKRIKYAGRFGVRYGVTLKNKINEIEKKQRGKHKCPYCSKDTVTRLSIGIWECSKCKAKFTGKAYEV